MTLNGGKSARYTAVLVFYAQVYSRPLVSQRERGKHYIEKKVILVERVNITDEYAINAGLHLRPAEYNNGQNVPAKPQQPNTVEEYARNDKLEKLGVGGIVHFHCCFHEN